MWLDRHGVGQGPVTDFEVLGGGTQNQVVRFRSGSDLYVLRTGPTHPRPGSDETIRREIRILQALEGTSLPVPSIVAPETDAGVLGGAFYVMTAITGRQVQTNLDYFDDSLDAKRRIGGSMVECLAGLRELDYRALALESFGRPAGYLERQVTRWSAQLQSYSSSPLYPGPGVDLEPVERWLGAHRPHDGPIGIMHGDFHLGNVLLSDTGEVCGILDWELSTIGDPILDFAQLLVTWPSPGQTFAYAGIVPTDRAKGFATTKELVELYSEVLSEPPHLDWYCVLAAYRLGVLVEGTQARASTGLASPEVGALLHNSARALWDIATSIVEGSNSLFDTAS